MNKEISFFIEKLRWKELKKQFVELTKGITIRDLLWLSIFPVFITLFMFLPEKFVSLLRLNIRNPSWWQYLTQSFIHFSWEHYKSNVFLYFFLIFFIILLANLGRKKKEFYNLFLFLVISFPIFSSFVQVLFYPIVLGWLPSLKFLYGSSGIISALFGFLPVFWILYIKHKNPSVKINFLFVGLFVTYGSVVFTYFYGKNLMLIFLLILLFLFLLINFNLVKISVKEIFWESKNNLLVCLVMVFIVSLFVLGPFFIFPSSVNLFKGGAFIDIGGHYLGFIYGLVIGGFYVLFFR